MTPDTLPSGPGTYILILQLENDKRIQIAKLGQFRFPTGYYAYVGSAFGPGGLAGRLKHHLHPGKKLHWHIDYFLDKAEVKDVIFIKGKKECKLSKNIKKLSMKTIEGFGSSDCKCSSHLFKFTFNPMKSQKFIEVFKKNYF